jgi:hypothetical protein
MDMWVRPRVCDMWVGPRVCDMWVWPRVCFYSLQIGFGTVSTVWCFWGGGAFCLFFSLVCRHRLMTPIIIFTPPQPRPHPNEKRKLFKRTVIIIICIYYVLLYIIHVNILKQLTRSVLTRWKTKPVWNSDYLTNKIY